MMLRRIISILTFSNFVWSQEFGGEPSCAVSQPSISISKYQKANSCQLQCFSSAVAKNACDTTDLSCQCQPDTQDAILKYVTPCVLIYCTPPEIAIVASIGRDFCLETSTTTKVITKTNTASCTCIS